MGNISNLNDSLKDMPFLREKCIVDMINNIDVANDHIQQQKNSSSFFTRLSDSITGKGNLRQIEINRNLQVGLKNVSQLINILTDDITQVNNALCYVSNQVKNIQQHMVKQVNYMVELRHDFENFKQNVNHKLSSIEHEIHRINIEQRVDTEINMAFEKWEAGRLHNFKPAERYYLTLENLSWGSTGYLYNTNKAKRQEIKERIINKSIIQLRKDLVGYVNEIGVSITDCISEHNPENLQYASDWADSSSPFVLAINGKHNVYVPSITQIEIIGERMALEVFDNKNQYYGVN